MDMPIPATTGNTIRAFLEQIFQGAGAGTVVLWSKLGGVYPYPVTDLEGAAAKLAELALRGDTYVGRGLQGVPLSPGERGKEPGIVFVGGLFADIDTREGLHATPEAELPADADEAMKLIAEAKLPPPTLLIGTGGGCHAHWLYSSPAMILTPEERAAEKMLSKAIQKRLRDTFKARGYVLDGTADLTRVCKAPGTLNHKTAPKARPVRLIHQGERYDRAELAELLASDLGIAARGVPGAGKGTVADMIRAEAKKAFLASNKAKPDELPPILAGCAWLKSVVDRADRGEKLTEEEWYAMLGIVARTTQGRKEAHEISKRDPELGRYDPAETDAKIDHALNDAGPANCRETIQEKLNFKGCDRCTFRGLITSPMNLAPEPTERVAVQQDTIYAQQGRIYLRLSDGERFDVPSYSDGMLSRVGDNPHHQLMKSKKTAIVTRLGYVPGDNRMIVKNERGTLIANQWRPGGVVPAKGMRSRCWSSSSGSSRTRAHVST